MALISCSECGAQISDRATSCPNCGNPLGSSVVLPRPRTARIVVLTIIACIGAAIAFSLYITRDEAIRTAARPIAANEDVQAGAHADAPVAPPPAPNRDESPVNNTPIELRATQLIAAYKANEVLADSKYKGKWLKVDGIVTEVGKDFLDDPYVKLLGYSENPYEYVEAMFSQSANERLALLKKGQEIVLTCRGAGMTVDLPILDCKGAVTSQAAAAPPPSLPAGHSSSVASSPTAAARSVEASQVAPVASRPSFDCALAKSDAEQLICGDDELAAADRRLDAVFRRAQAAATDKAAFKQSVRQEWNYREQACHDKACLVRWYAAQQDNFAQIAATGRAQ